MGSGYSSASGILTTHSEDTSSYGTPWAKQQATSQIWASGRTLSPDFELSNSTEWKATNIVREDYCEYETHPAGELYFLKLEKPNSVPQTLNLKKDGNKPRPEVSRVYV